MNTDRDPRSEQADRRQAIDTTLGSALDPILRKIAKEGRADARKRIVKLVDDVLQEYPPA